MDSFKKLLDIVRQKDSSLITEEQAIELSNAYDNNIALIEENAEKCGIAKGYADGFAEGKAAAEKSFSDEKERLVSESRRFISKKLNEVEKSAFENGKKVMLEEAKNEYTSEKERLISESRRFMSKKLNEVEKSAFENGKKAMLTEAKKSVVDNIDAILSECVESCDNEATEKLKVLMEAVDENHTKALQNVYKLMTEKNAALQAKINALVSENELANAKIKEITEENNSLNDAILNKGNECVNQVCEQVDRFLNYALEQNIPTKQIVSESKFNAAQNTIGRIIDVLKVNDILQESRSNIILDYESKISNANKSIDKLTLENTELAKKLDKQQATILLESKLSKCTGNEANYLRNYFKNAANSAIIEEQIEGARLAYRKLYEEKRNANVASIKAKTNSTSSNMVSESVAPVKKAEVITESKKENKNEAVCDAFNMYKNAYLAMTNHK